MVGGRVMVRVDVRGMIRVRFEMGIWLELEREIVFFFKFLSGHVRDRKQKGLG